MSGVADSPTVLAGRYRLERELGRGGMGAVYLALDLKHNREVAVKLIGEGFGSTNSVERFLAEIHTAAQLNHPHILSVHDSGESGGELYYVMPHVQGASLREKLDREHRLPITEALRIGCQIASALAYAHAHGVIHRDVKPENVLLDPQGHAYLMDFGLARALSTVTAGRLTAVGITVGSPSYMSPEQVAGEKEIDGRSDIYSFGCTLFEMLVGQPPFSGPDAQTLLRQHLTESPPSLRGRRADIPPALERVVRTALAKAPDQRQVSADQLGRELHGLLTASTGQAESTPRPASPRWLRRTAIAIGTLLVGVAAVIWAIGTDSGRTWLGIAPPDSGRWLVLPLQWTEGSEPSPDRAEDRQLYAAFDRWNDLLLVDRLTVSEAVEQRGGTRALSASVGFDLAQQLDAGRLVQGLATRLGDSIQIDLTLSNVGREGLPVRQVSMRVPSGGSSQAGYSLAVDSLIFGRVSWSDGPEWDIGTRSAAARRAYGAAHDALDSWAVERADSLFRIAVDRDPSFARAHFWVSQLGSWMAQPGNAWLPSARRALARRENLTTRERILAAGLVALGEGRYPEACESYRRLTESDDRDFAGWFGLGECITSDKRVVRDASSPSGWRFRASYHRGVEAYRRAFDLAPGSHRLVRSGGFARVRDHILFTRRNKRRDGLGEVGSFSARPQWLADSLALTPFPWRRGEPHPDPALPGTDQALLEQRLLFRDIARGWSVAYANDAHALHAVALSLEMLGDAAALDTLLRARQLATHRSDQLELSIQEVWLRVKLSPIRETDLAAARLLADSILRSPEATLSLPALRLAALCVLVGKPTLGATYAARDAAAVVRSEFPSSISRPAAALLVFAAAGAPLDSIAALEAATESAIRNGVVEEDRVATRRMLLERASIIAFPSAPFDLVRHGSVFQSVLSRAQTALTRADTAAAIAILQPYREAPGVTLDMAYSAAALAAMAGDTATAVAILDVALEGVRWLQPGMIEDVAHAGAFVRAMALRAELASAVADSATARRWARAVVSLWASGEPAVQSLVQRMRRLMG